MKKAGILDVTNSRKSEAYGVPRFCHFELASLF